MHNLRHIPFILGIALAGYKMFFADDSGESSLLLEAIKLSMQQQ